MKKILPLLLLLAFAPQATVWAQSLPVAADTAGHFKTLVTGVTVTAQPANGGVPTGGTTGQTLVKNSNTTYDYSWAAGGGSGTINSGTLNTLSYYSGTTTLSSVPNMFYAGSGPVISAAQTVALQLALQNTDTGAHEWDLRSLGSASGFNGSFGIYDASSGYRFLIDTNGKAIFTAPTTSAASINLPHGTAPTSPVNGDLWTTTAGLFARVNTTTVGPFSTGGGTAGNPTTSIGLSVNNGVASTYMRSDGAPALSQAIAPTWTNPHFWDTGSGALPATVAATTALQTLARADAVIPGVESFGYNTAAYQLYGRAIGGTRAAPAATAADQTFYVMAGYGYGTSLVTSSRGFFAMRADGLWSGTNNGTYYEWTGTASGATSSASWMKLQNGSLQLLAGGFRSTGADIWDANAMAALAIDVTKKLNTKTVAVDSTLTFSATPAVSNTYFTLRLTNSDTNPHVITIPSTFDSNSQQTITSFNILAGGVETVTWCYDGTNYIGYGVPTSGSSAEVTVASATTTAIGAASSLNVAISGTTTITGFGTVAAGTYRVGRFTGILTLTYNASSMILPNGGSNITTAAGDTFGARSEGSGNWRVLWYQPFTRASGTGTVTATGGSLTANAVVLGAGTTDTKVVTGITTDGTSKINLGVAGSSVGSVVFSNATSGTLTVNPPTGALGSITTTLPNASSTLPIFGQQITFAGPTAARTVTLPDAAFTVARTDAANTFTGASTATSWTLTTPVLSGTVTGTYSLGGVPTIAPTARSSGATAYLTITTPTDTGQTAATESIGINKATATRTWATTGTVALQREVFFSGPTYASASASQTFTDAFNLYLTPPVAGTNAIFTRGHSLGIVDSTSAASSITGGLVVSTTLGTTATSVGIGGGNVNAGGTITAGGVVTASTTLELGNASDTTLARNAAGQISVEGGLVPTFVAQGTLSGTTPALTFTLSDKTDTITLSGNTTFSASGMTAGYKYTIFITCDGTGRTLSFPAWTWLEGTPSSIAASKEMRIDLYCKSTTAASVIAVYGVQP